MSEDPNKVIQFEPEDLSRMKAKAELLADMREADRAYWLPKYAEEIGAIRSLEQASPCGPNGTFQSCGRRTAPTRP
jgi:hypothetical protein